jgi:hypothetical protein
MRRLLVPIPTLALAALALCGCTTASGPPAAAADQKPLPSVAPLDARAQLAGLVATAKDRHFTAGYAYTPTGGSARTLTVALATDGTWRIDVPGGALGGQADVALAGTRKGLYQCRLGVDRPTCVKAADPGGSWPDWADPQVQHPFVDWFEPLTDREAALSVAAAPLLDGARGACFSVEANSAALAAPIPPGIYCYDVDGTLTGFRTAFGSLALATRASPAPPTITLPGPITQGAVLPTAAPAPSPTPSAKRSVAPAPASRRH